MGETYSFYKYFSSNITTQLGLFAPAIVPALVLLVIFSGFWLRQSGGRRFLGGSFLLTIGAYAVLALLIISLPVVKISYGLSHPVLIFFALAFVALLVIWLALTLAIRGLRRNRAKWAGRRWLYGYAGFQLIFLLSLGYAFYIEPQWLDVTETTVALQKLPAGSRPLKVAFLSDIHMEHWTGRETKVLAELEARQPDLIFLGGDYLNFDFSDDARAREDLHRFLRGLHAPLGVYAVERLSVFHIDKLIGDTNVKLLWDRTAVIDLGNTKLYLVCVTSQPTGDDRPQLYAAQKDVPAGALKMLLYHTPDLAPVAATEQYDFYFAGHTHGGQVALPFYGAIYTNSRFGRTYAAGLYNLGGPADTRLYVTRGLGMEGYNLPRMRFFARPEISFFNFIPAS